MVLAHNVDTVSALVESLRFDPFYRAISGEFARDEVRRRAALARYFDYSMSEGARTGRLVVHPNPAMGAAVWLLPQQQAASAFESAAKSVFLAEAMGAHARDVYHRIVDFMKPRALAVVGKAAWYLSIVGVAPAAQGQGIGAGLIEPTLAEADAAGVECYLETFDHRNPRFYQKLGFVAVGTHVESLTASAYTIMSRRACGGK